MKKSQKITLTLVAAVGMAMAQGQTTAPPAQDCAAIRKAARQAGTPVPPDCAGHHYFGGFGSTAHGVHGGG